MKLMFKYMKPYRGKVVLTVFLKFAAVILELLIPYMLEYMIDEAAPKKQIIHVIAAGFVMVMLAILVRNMNVTANRMATLTARDSIYNLRGDLFKKTIYLKGSSFDFISLPSLISRMTSDSYNVQSFIGMIQRVGVRAPIMLTGGLLVAGIMDIHLSIVLLCMIPVMMFVTVFVSAKGIPVFRNVQAKLDDVVRILRENITGVRIIRALSKSDYEKKRFSYANKNLTDSDIRAGMMMALPNPLMNLLLNAGFTLIVVIGAYMVNSGEMKPGVILAFLTYFNMILQAVMGINRIFIQYSKAGASADRISLVLSVPDEERHSAGGNADGAERAGTTHAYDVQPAPEYDADTVIEFDNVSFRYDNNSAESLKNISFKIRKGESLGIIGSTGSGKSTLLNLLLAFYDVSSGTIRLHGLEIRDMTLHEIRRKFGVVFQNDTIFNDTIYENINFGRGISVDEARKAAEMAMIGSFDMDYPVAIKGMNLSGGQRQRLLIARALAGGSEIIVFDDSSSALDYRTDASIRKNIKKKYKDSIRITVAQRVSSVKDMTNILVLEEGEMIGLGTHESLLRECSVYKDIYESQMGAFE